MTTLAGRLGEPGSQLGHRASGGYQNNLEVNDNPSLGVPHRDSFQHHPHGLVSQLVGAANGLPIIKTSPSFISIGPIQSGVYILKVNGDEWYVEQSNFYRQVWNFVIDIEQTTKVYAAALHWQVA